MMLPIPWPVILPTQRLCVDGFKEARIVTPITFRCVPLRPIIPSYICVDFDVVGVEKNIPGDEKSTEPAKKRWANDVGVPACCFSESSVLELRMKLSELAVGHELILVVKNLQKAPRQFACGWLVDEKWGQ